MRKLASIQKIVSLKPIPGADRIVAATVLGWEVVVKKDEFNIGDKIIYIEIDSLLPDRPEFEFMKSKKFRVRTIKLKSQISQGIVFPLGILPTGVYGEGQDVTELLGVKNYQDSIEVKDPASSKKSNGFLNFLYKYSATRWLAKLLSKIIFKRKTYDWPEFVPKTDEERLQNNPQFIDDLGCTQFYITEKLDGQSASYFVKTNGLRKTFGVCSRNLCLPKQKCNWWEIAEKYDLEKKMKAIGKDFYIQGEIIGPGIQSNRYQLKEKEFYLFNAYSLNQKRFLGWGELKAMALALGVKIVPIITCEFYPTSVADWVLFSDKKSVLFDVDREGIVIRKPNSSVKNSVKVINPKYLLRFEE